VEFIDALIDAYESTGRFVEAEKESMYAMRVEEAAYGRGSVKLLPRLDKLALWYEASRRYTCERNIYERALAILAKHASENDIRRVEPLRGIARAFRLEAFYGMEGADMGASFNSGTPGAPVFSDGTQQRRGEAALNSALAVIAANQPVDERLRGLVLTDLGDWYLVTNAVRRAYDTYAEAWKAFASVADTSLLEMPRILAYRPSISSVERSQLEPAEAEVKIVELHCKIDRDGRVDEVSSPTMDVPEAVVRNSVASMRRSRYAPRIENGIAVPTEKVIFLERVLVKATPPESATSSGKEEAKPAEQEPVPVPEPTT
jgi:hypothetical protein